MTYKRFDIVKVPFPFTDPYATKTRPAVIISAADPFNARSEHSVMTMITSVKQADWPLDTVITDLDSAGLPVASKIRLKLFTLDHRLIRGTLGQLAAEDQATFSAQLDLLLGKTVAEDSAV